tara:strand:- start:451 stop:963 length:513 start_codon:yes stop_codon:yes gene_type:complete
MLIKFLSLNSLLLFLVALFISTTLSSGEELFIEIDNPKFSEKGLSDKTYEIKAEKGLKSDNELKLFLIEGKFKTAKDGKWIYLEADKGSYSQDNKFIELEENIIFYTDDGEKLSSKYATFDIQNDIIELVENVSHKNIKGLILSDSSIITNNFNKITYFGNVESLINASE